MFKRGQRVLFTPHNSRAYKTQIVTILEVDRYDDGLPYRFALKEDKGCSFWCNCHEGTLTPYIPENV